MLIFRPDYDKWRDVWQLFVWCICRPFFATKEFLLRCIYKLYYRLKRDDDEYAEYEYDDDKQGAETDDDSC